MQQGEGGAQRVLPIRPFFSFSRFFPFVSTGLGRASDSEMSTNLNGANIIAGARRATRGSGEALAGTGRASREGTGEASGAATTRPRPEGGLTMMHR